MNPEIEEALSILTKRIRALEVKELKDNPLEVSAIELQEDLGYIDFAHVTPDAPSTGFLRIYAKADDNAYKQDSAGVETVLGGGGGASLTIEEIDGTPSVANVTEIHVTNGTLTDLGGGIVQISYSPSGEFFYINLIIDGGGAVITAGIKGFVMCPAGTIVGCWLLADQSGDIVVDIWKDTYANYPPDDADTITGGAEPELSAASKYQDIVLAGWTTAIADGDILGFNVDNAATVERVTVVLKVQR